MGSGITGHYTVAPESYGLFLVLQDGEALWAEAGEWMHDRIIDRWNREHPEAMLDPDEIVLGFQYPQMLKLELWNQPRLTRKQVRVLRGLIEDQPPGTEILVDIGRSYYSFTSPQDFFNRAGDNLLRVATSLRKGVQGRRKRGGLGDPTSGVRTSLLDAPTKPTSSPAFKAWFGGSQAVDGAGNPLVLFHGTKSPPSKFAPSHPGVGSTVFGPYGVTRHGIFLAEDPKLAEEFATQGGEWENSSIMPVYLRAESPIDLRHEIPDSVFNALEDKSGWNLARFILGRYGTNAWKLFDEDEGSDPSFVIEALKGLNYDSAIILEQASGSASGTTWVAFDSTQVKSAIANVGAYSNEKEEITASGPYPPATKEDFWDRFTKSPRGAKRDVTSRSGAVRKWGWWNGDGDWPKHLLITPDGRVAKVEGYGWHDTALEQMVEAKEISKEEANRTIQVRRESPTEFTVSCGKGPPSEAQKRRLKQWGDDLPKGITVYPLIDEYSPTRGFFRGSSVHVHFQNDVTVYHHGQTDGTLYALSTDGSVLGYISWSVYGNQLYVNNILVEPSTRRQHIGSEMFQALLQEFPDKVYHQSYRTPEGGAFFNSPPVQEAFRSRRQDRRRVTTVEGNNEKV